MATCAECNQPSAATDYCDSCGAAMQPGSSTLAPPTLVTAPVQPPEPPAAQECASCGAVRYGRFCEECGHDASAPAPERPADARPSPTPRPTPQAWTAVVRADRTWFEEVRARNGPDAGGLEFPQFCPERRFPLTGAQLTIGRRSRSRGVEPEIDLTGPPLDPGVSTLHALLVPADDGGWQVVDLASTNGTTVGEGTALIASNTRVPLADGDVIKIGAWTTITVVRG